MAEQPKPIIFSIDDDEQVLRSLKRDLRNQYRQDYRIISTSSCAQGLEAVKELKKKGEAIALFLSDQRMPEMLGVDFLEEARKTFPDAKRVLLTAYSDTDAAIKAINDVQLDYYLVKPWNPPEERLYPVLNDLLEDWQAEYQPNFRGIRIIGYQYSPKSHNLKDFLAGNLRPYQWLDVEHNPEATELLELHEITEDSLPAVLFEEGAPLIDPSVQELAERIGLNPHAPGDTVYDVIIIGAGPAGLAAAVYGGSEGLKTLLIERRNPGGQAGTSSRIENYLGFPNGLSGADLTRRALAQAQRFGIDFLSPQEVNRIEIKDNYKVVHLTNGTPIHTRAIVITTGVDYRRLPAEGADNFAGAGVYYGAAMTEAQSCLNRTVYVVGGGNSAGQGAVYLSKYAKEVNILIRKPDLTSSMSDYLIKQIEGIENIQVHGYRQIKQVCGNGHVEQLVIENLQTQEDITTPADALFIFIGARPYTDWLDANTFIRNDRGFIHTGPELLQHSSFKKIWKQKRDPYLLETCQAGIFAAGDVRAGAMNRVASAVGEGAMAIKFVHEYLAKV